MASLILQPLKLFRLKPCLELNRQPKARPEQTRSPIHTTQRWQGVQVERDRRLEQRYALERHNFF